MSIRKCIIWIYYISLCVANVFVCLEVSCFVHACLVGFEVLPICRHVNKATKLAFCFVALWI